jgi:hypothetical protein
MRNVPLSQMGGGNPTKVQVSLEPELYTVYETEPNRALAERRLRAEGGDVRRAAIEDDSITELVP